MSHFDVPAHTHLLVVAGSRAYGMHTPTSDVDVKGIAVPPVGWYLGLHSFEQTGDGMEAFLPRLTEEERRVSAETKLEGTIFELRKLVRLALDCNPNILELLFCRDAEVRLITPLGARLRENARLFLSSRARHTFGGYAMSQLKRIQTHRAWLLDPPARQPTRADFDLPDHTLIPSDQLAAAEAAVRKQVDSWELGMDGVPESARLDAMDKLTAALAEMSVAADDRWRLGARFIGLDDNFIQLMERERRYESARAHWRQYEGWKKARNPDRAALEAKYGYDTKHAAHLVRLLRMGREILTTGEVNVWRGDLDAAELLAIRAGEWRYDDLVAWAEAAQAELVAAAKTTALPRAPDFAGADALCVELVREAVGV
jgi:predicted nucleotidyltransferase